MYKHCYDENHSFFEFDSGQEIYNKKRRKGLYEKLLCRSCEDILKDYEDYAKSILYEGVKPYIYRNKTSFSTTEYDYKKFKLFVLSLLWRASISSQDSFKLVSLGPYEEKLRIILFEQQEISVNNFPSVIYQTYIGAKPADGVFMAMYPSKAKFDRKTIYQFVVDGLFFFIGVGFVSIRAFPNGSSVSPESLRIGWDDLTKIQSFVNLFADIHKQGKFLVYEK